LAFDESCDGEVIKEVGEVLPNIRCPVLPQALIIKPIHLGNLSRLMVPPQNSDPGRVTDFEGNEEAHSLNRVEASIHVISHEQVVGLGQIPANPEELNQIMELAVHVPAHRHRAAHRLHIGLIYKYFLRLSSTHRWINKAHKAGKSYLSTEPFYLSLV